MTTTHNEDRKPEFYLTKWEYERRSPVADFNEDQQKMMYGLFYNCFATTVND